MRLFNFHIPGPLDARLKEESRRTGIPLSEIARRALDEHLERRERQRRKQEATSCGETGSR